MPQTPKGDLKFIGFLKETILKAPLGIWGCNCTLKKNNKEKQQKIQ